MMKSVFAASALVVLASGPALAWERVTTEQQFRDRVVDRQIVTDEGNTYTSHADGRVTGTWQGHRMVGGWQWHQGFWCRNVRVGQGQETGTDCQVIELQGNQLRSTREQGRGTSGVGTIQ
ncbi:MAG: hypothetical protein JJU15_16935 [Pararhodobacter sp.]|nr:hypothetical protein [Pararhodobacter sp.]